MATIKGKPRYIPEIIWSDKSWTHNFFRFLELIFGREYGIRAENNTNFILKNGKLITRIEIYTFEALCAFIETEIRNFFLYKIFPFKIVAFKYAIPNLNSNAFFPGLLFDLAYDNGSFGNLNSGTSISFSFTCTGSNLFLGFLLGLDDSNNYAISSATYKSVSLTNASVDGNYTIQNKHSKIWYLKAPSTGTNTLSITLAGIPSNFASGGAISLTGVDQTTPKDRGSGSSNANGSTLSLTNSAASANEWQISVVCYDTDTLNDSTNQTTKGTDTSQAFSNVSWGAKVLAGSGSQTVAWTTSFSSDNYAMSVLYIIPATAVAQTGLFFPFFPVNP